jgi:secondary thiamine-phosphate synthase enzyme
MVYQQQLTLQTNGHRHMQDITSELAEVVRQSGITTGVAQVFSVGSTSAVGVVEFEPGLERDVPEMLDRLIPPSRQLGHEQAWHDGNGHSHLQATMLGPSLAVPISDGQLVLGTWQQVFHLECDVKPRQRTVVVTVMGESGC